MRVLSSIPDPREGGPHRRSLAVARGLRQYDIETVFLLPAAADEFASKARKYGFTVEQKRFPRIRAPRQVGANLSFLVGFLPAVRRIRTVIDRHDIDVVHANAPLNLPTALASARSDAALVWHFNDTLTPWPLNRLTGQLAMRWADIPVVAADSVHGHFFPPETATDTLYAPVDIEEYDPANRSIDEREKRAELGLDHDVPVVGMVGNINPVKGVDTFVRAISRIVEEYGDVAGVVVGSQLESQSAYYERVVDLCEELGVDEHITFTGWRSDVPELLSLFDLFTLPSSSEACPMVVLEAMAMCCPVVATTVGGVPEMIPDEDHGWTVPPDDPEAFAVAVCDALENPNARAQRAAQAYQRVRDRFSLSACLAAHDEVYRTAADRAGRRI